MFFKRFIQDFLDLRNLPREFWGIQTVNILESFAVFVLLMFNALYLEIDFGFEDITRGWVIGGFMGGFTITIFLGGFLLDALGFRRLIKYGMYLSAVGRVGYGLAPMLLPISPTLKLLGVIVLIPIMLGEGLTIATLNPGVKRFTDTKSRSTSFNLWYMIMNVGAILAGLLIMARNPEGGNGWMLLVTALPCFIAAFFANSLFVDERQVQEEEDGTILRVEGDNANQRNTIGDIFKHIAGLFKGIVRERTFWIVVTFLFVVLGARLTFSLPFTLYPQYWTRVISEDVNVGFIMMLNPILIVLGVGVFNKLSSKMHIYWALMLGMIIASSSMFILAISPQMIGINGASAITTFYWTVVILQIVMYAVGEAIFSPFMANYVTSLAPTGKEGSYVAMTQIPNVLSKVLTGALSGYFLVSFCPKGIREGIDAGTLAYTQRPEMMYFLLGFMCLSSPLLLLILKKIYYIDPTKSGAGQN